MLRTSENELSVVFGRPVRGAGVWPPPHPVRFCTQTECRSVRAFGHGRPHSCSCCLRFNLLLLQLPGRPALTIGIGCFLLQAALLPHLLHRLSVLSHTAHNPPSCFVPVFDRLPFYLIYFIALIVQYLVVPLLHLFGKELQVGGRALLVLPLSGHLWCRSAPSTMCRVACGAAACLPGCPLRPL